MSRRSNRHRLAADLQIRTPTAEKMLIEALVEVEGTRVLCTTQGRGQLAAATASQFPGAQVTCHIPDIFISRQTGELTRAGYTDRAGEGNLAIHCGADFPDQPFDTVMIPVHTQDEAELTRDYLQAGYQALEIGGRLLAAVWKRNDVWLYEELRKLSKKVTRVPQRRGVLYIVTKTEPLKKMKRFTCEFAFRDQERLIRLVSRPGVFSHRSLDGGARSLINSMQVKAGDRVLDIGCGCGAVGLAAAFRAPDVSVVALDSNARAVECTLAGAALNELTTVTARLTCDGDSGAPGTFDLAVGNPPYYSSYKISEIFLDAAYDALRPGGTVLMVTKTPEWFEEHMQPLFDDVTLIEHKSYTVVQGTQRA